MIPLHLALKDLRLLMRDPIALFWVLGFPLLFALFLGGVVRAGLRGQPGPLQLVVVDEARTSESARLVAELESSERLVVRTEPADRARRAVRRAEAVAYLELPRGFRFEGPGTDAAGSGGNAPAPALRLGIDPSREVEGAFIQSAIAQAAVALHASAPPGAPRTASTPTPPGSEPGLPIVVEREDTQREAELVFPAAVLWGLIGCAACFAISMVTERTRGTFLRLVAAPIDKSALLWGKALACLLACLAVAAILTAVAALGFGVRFEQPWLVALALASAALCFVGITMLLSLLGRTEQAVAGAGWAVLILMAMIGGGMVPLSMMPAWLLSVSHLSPAKWSILALEGATWRGFSPTELLVPCGILVAIAALGFGIGTRLLSRAHP
jgi:ABC-2 type transport system permease protein